jgi:hypothetical protein
MVACNKGEDTFSMIVPSNQYLKFVGDFHARSWPKFQFVVLIGTLFSELEILTTLPAASHQAASNPLKEV